MDDQMDLSCLTINVTSPMDTNSSDSGAVIIHGGVGIGQSLHVDKSITCNEMFPCKLQSTTISSKDIECIDVSTHTINTKTIQCDHLSTTSLNVKNMDNIFNNRVIRNIKSNNIESNTINIMNDCALGSLQLPCNCVNKTRCTCVGVPMLELSQSQSTIEINCNNFLLFNKATIVDKSQELNEDNDNDTDNQHNVERTLERQPVLIVNNEHIEIYQPLMINTLRSSQQIIKISSIDSDTLPLVSHITFICLDTKIEKIFKLSQNYALGTIRKIVLRKTKNNRSFTLFINEYKSYKFCNEDDYIEIIFDNTKWNFVSGNIRKQN